MWLTIAEWDGESQLGEVLGYVESETEHEAQAWANNGGWFLDKLDIDRPESFSIEVMTSEDFYASYGNRMPLRNNLTPKPERVLSHYELGLKMCADHYAFYSKY